ncbi:hypothetical protein CDAR_51741 [Caerostris darwini]|uniref:Uncharacterized protein n=1 Tax=Caerostris darwini TaxID=1538125 RepID=A0AAV4V8I6_9ARAC|nr:hypothetical protein CDAR_51741 [Caerostris darwini]
MLFWDFKKQGFIYPFDHNKLSEAEYALSEVTDQNMTRGYFVVVDEIKRVMNHRPISLSTIFLQLLTSLHVIQALFRTYLQLQDSMRFLASIK